MRARRIVPGVLVLCLVAPASVRSQVTPEAPPVQAAAVFTAEQLDQLLAPIALYPDPLLAQILMAATYPLEVVQAARWVQDPYNASLSDEALALALQNQDWDASVKSLVPFPQSLQMMNSRLDWLQQLGDAFLVQQADVMDAVQRLRRRAQAAGTLAPNAQQSVTTVGQMIEIEPASPQVIYVPCYNPVVIYGAWPYPAYPPIYFAPPPGCSFGPVLAFGLEIIVAPFLWGWHHWDWDHHRIRIDADRFNRIEVHRRFTGDTWEHDPYHRRGVTYRDPGTRARFPNARVSPPEASRAFRGYEGGRGVVPPPVRPGLAFRPAPSPSPGARPAPTRPAAPARPAAPTRPAAAPPIVQRTPPPAFESFGRGSDVRTQAQRGHTSLQTMPPRPVVPPRGAPGHAPAGPPRGGAPRK